MPRAPVKKKLKNGKKRKGNWLHLYAVGEIACLVNPERYASGNLMFLEGSPKPNRLKGRGQLLPIGWHM